MSGTYVRTLRFEAIEGVGGWHLRLVVSSHDDEGTPGEPLVLTADLSLPDVQVDVDQAWLALVSGCHMLEEAGSVGRISGLPGRAR